jgi:hypothetical protein
MLGALQADIVVRDVVSCMCQKTCHPTKIHRIHDVSWQQ